MVEVYYILLTVICESIKSPVSIILDGTPLTPLKQEDGVFYIEKPVEIGEHTIKIVQDHIMYHKKSYLMLINPVTVLRNIFFLRKFFYLDRYNAEADIILLKVRVNKENAKIKIKLSLQAIENNYTKHYDMFLCTESNGITILSEKHDVPPKDFIKRYCFIHFAPSVLLMLLPWPYSIAVTLRINAYITLMLYSIYAILNIIFDIRNIKKKRK